MTRVVIVGLGDVAHALSHLYNNYNSSQSGHTLEVTKPNAKKSGTFHDTGVPVSEFFASLNQADVVILAIPAAKLGVFMNEHVNILREKIIVDVTNSWVPGEDLNTILAMTEVRFAKAFNDIGAVDLLSNSPTGKEKIHSTICSKYPEAIDVVKDFAEKSLGIDMKIIPHERYAQIAQHQNTLGDHWMDATKIVLVIFLLSYTYTILRFNIFQGYAWFHLCLQLSNKVFGWTALWGFALSMIPGVLARLSNAIFGNSLRTKPSWLRSFLAMRKHLGIISLWFLMIHLMISLLKFSPAFYAFLFDDDKLNATGESSFLFGILGTGLFAILGICSLPSVGSRMTSKQWQLVFGPVAWLGLIFGTAHVVILGIQEWNSQQTWPGGLPPITLISSLLPLSVMIIKVAQFIITRCGRFGKRAVCHKGPDTYKVDASEQTSHHSNSERSNKSERPRLKNGETVNVHKHTESSQSSNATVPFATSSKKETATSLSASDEFEISLLDILEPCNI